VESFAVSDQKLLRKFPLLKKTSTGYVHSSAFPVIRLFARCDFIPLLFLACGFNNGVPEGNVGSLPT
jgi:hypothetical protein